MASYRQVVDHVWKSSAGVVERVQRVSMACHEKEKESQTVTLGMEFLSLGSMVGYLEDRYPYRRMLWSWGRCPFFRITASIRLAFSNIPPARSPLTTIAAPPLWGKNFFFSPRDSDKQFSSTEPCSRSLLHNPQVQAGPDTCTRLSGTSTASEVGSCSSLPLRTRVMSVSRQFYIVSGFLLHVAACDTIPYSTD